MQCTSISLLCFHLFFFFFRKKLISSTFCVCDRVVRELPKHLWSSFLGSLSLGFRVAQWGGSSLACQTLLLSPAPEQQKETVPLVCLHYGQSYFPVLQSRVIYRTLDQDLDCRYMMVGRFFCVLILENTMHCLGL